MKLSLTLDVAFCEWRHFISSRVFLIASELVCKTNHFMECRQMSVLLFDAIY